MSKVSFDLGPELQGYVDRVVKEVLPETHKALLEEVTELRTYAEAHWPTLEQKDPATIARLRASIEAGKLQGQTLNLVSKNSKSKWKHGVRMTPDGLEGFVHNSAPYSAFVTHKKEKGQKRAKRVFHTVLFKRFGAKRQNALYARIAKELG